jgi:hypothetical protein
MNASLGLGLMVCREKRILSQDDGDDESWKCPGIQV